MSALVPQPGDSVQSLHARVTGLQVEIRDRAAEFERAKSDLAAFRIRYRTEVGTLHEQLDQLELAIAEAELGELSRKLDEAGRTASSPTSPPTHTQARYTSDAVRRLFRDVAKAIHPDRAHTDHARDRRHALMIEANRAYASGDEERLRRILRIWDESPDAVLDDDPDSVRTRLVRRIAELEDELAASTGEFAELRETPLWKLKAMVDDAAGRGQDLVADMVKRLNRDIMVARNRLDAIRWRR